MEARQLAYFVLACQHRNHAEAAAYLGISASALSENLSLLEKELQISLFQRGPLGLYPSEAARWLYQSTEPVLRCLEDAEEALRSQIPLPDLRLLEVISPLSFLMGRISRAASLAARSLRKSHPEILTTIRFAGPTGSNIHTDFEEILVKQPNHQSSNIAARIIINDIDERTDVKPIVILHDRWVCVTSLERVSDPEQVIDFATLRKSPLYVPALRPALIHQLREYCIEHGLPEPMIFDDDVGTFPKLSRMTEAFNLLAPQSMVAEGLTRLNLGYMHLPRELESSVTATILVDHPSAHRYVDFLKQIAQNKEKPILAYRPRMTFKQARYFLTLCDELNMTAAARKLNVVQPAISSQLSKLEKLFAVKLFRRHSAGIETTLHGNHLKEHLSPAFDILEDVSLKAPHYAAAQQARLTIGVIPMVNYDGPLVAAISGALEEWSKNYPGVRLHVLEAPMQVLHRWIESGKISLALVEAQVSRNSQLDLGVQDILGVVSSLPTTHLPPGNVTLAQVAKLSLVLPDETFGLRQLLSHATAEAHVRLIPSMEVNSLSMVLGIVARGKLATILPYHAIRLYVDTGTFQFNQIVQPVLRRRLSFLFSANRSLTEMERGLVSMIKHYLATNTPTSP